MVALSSSKCYTVTVKNVPSNLIHQDKEILCWCSLGPVTNSFAHLNTPENTPEQYARESERDENEGVQRVQKAGQEDSEGEQKESE